MKKRFAFFGAPLILAALFVGCGGDNSSSPSPVDVAITIQGIQGNMSFSPATATVRVGQIIEWRNTDSVVHDLDEDSGIFDTGNISPGTTSRTLRMNTVGQFPYHCTIHPGMVGTIVVVQ